MVEDINTKSCITGPIKFDFYTKDIKRAALGFWCVMMERKLFDEIGLLDEIFSPGMGEDGDFCIKAEMAGHDIVQVPLNENDSHMFGDKTGVEKAWSTFPIMHRGSATFGHGDYKDLIARNKKILDDRYGSPNTIGNNMNDIKYSIVIPTFQHCDDLLKPCIESIIEHTDLDNVEIIVVANGCTDNTAKYVDELKEREIPVKLVWSDEALGYTKATNEGIKIAKGEYVVLLNNDTLMLPQSRNLWLQLLEEPFSKKEMGLTGPLQLYDNYANAPVLIFFCVMIKRELFDKIGLLDESFSPGGGEDIDFTIRARAAGYDAQVITETTFNGGTNVGNFPIWHKDNKTFGEIPEYTNWIVKRNGHLNCKRYNKNIKLNLGSGGVDYPGYLSVDLYDKRAHIIMDIEKNMDFEDNSVTEILASHIFEHFSPYKIESILKEWFRILKPGGKLIMEMPNIEELCRNFITADYQKRFGILNAIYGSVNTTDVGERSDITSPHLFGWWPEAIWQYLRLTGFDDIVFGPEQIPHPESNFRTEAIKPNVKPTTPKIDHERLKSQEPAIYSEIFEVNTYQLKEDDVRGKTVIDAGANLGYFSLKCIEMGAKFVVAVEAQPTIYKLGLLPNISEYNILPSMLALTDKDGETVHIENQHVGSHIGGTSGESVMTVKLETLINSPHLKDAHDMVLKLDIEGSEYDVLLNSSNECLRRFKTIFLEVHGDSNPNPQYKGSDIIHKRLSSAGFVMVHAIQQFGGWAKDDQYYTQEWMDIFVEKWVRNT